jgi:hypothetical protein
MQPDWDDGLPVLRLAPVDEDLRDLFRGTQEAVLTHPVAAQALWATLVAEGRRASATPTGAALRRRLARSPLLPRLRETLELGSFNLLEADPAGPLPSDFLEVLSAVLAEGRPLLDRLARP